MAATRRNAMLIEEARNKIRTTQLINRLQDHGFGKVELSTTQVRALEILLKKTVPDLAALQLSGDRANPIEINVTQEERRRLARAAIDAAFAEPLRLVERK